MIYVSVSRCNVLHEHVIPSGEGGLTTETLRSDIDVLLRRASPWSFPLLLEAQYRTRNNMPRRHRLMAAMAFVGAMVGAGAGLDWLAGKPVFDAMLMLRVPAALACLVAALALRRVRRVWQEAMLLAVPLLGALLVVELGGQAARGVLGPAYMDRTLVAVAVALAAVLMLPQWRYAALRATGWVGVLAFPLVPLLAPDRQTHLAEIGFGECMLLLALVAARRVETARRTIFLHDMRNELAGVALHRANAEVLRLSTTDTLTGFANRRHFDAELARIWRDRGRTHVGIALVEIDGFSDFIERAGAAEADICLREVARVVSSCLRQDWDRAGRWQDAAFAALLPAVEREELADVGERLRQAVANLAIQHPNQPGRFVSVSVGLAWCSGTSGHVSAAQVLQDADAALFAAKSLGANRVILAGDARTHDPVPMMAAAYRPGAW